MSTSMHAPTWSHSNGHHDARTSETRYHSSPDAIRRATGKALPRAMGASTSNANAFTFGQIPSEPLTATAQNINLEEVVSKVGADICEIDRAYLTTKPASSPEKM
jgi:hypothetical protein